MYKLPFFIPLHVHPYYPIIAFLLAFMWAGSNFTLMFLLVGVITISILVHELGHALAGLAFNQKVSISLLPFGGLTQRRGKTLKAWQDFIVVLMGPLFGFGFYFVASYFLKNAPPQTLWTQALYYTAFINLMWTVLNLIPVIPLDGGQLVRIILQAIWGVKGLRAACILSIIIAAVVGVYFLLNQQIFAASFFAFFAYESWVLYRSVRFLKNQDTDIFFQRILSKGEKAYKKGDYEKGIEHYEEVRQKANSGTLYNFATLRLASLAQKSRDFNKAYELLEPIKNELDYEGLSLFQEVAFETTHWEDALFSGSQLAQTKLTIQIAHDNAVSAYKLNKMDAANGWAKAYKKLGGDDTQLF